MVGNHADDATTAIRVRASGSQIRSRGNKIQQEEGSEPALLLPLDDNTLLAAVEVVVGELVAEST